MAVPSLTCLSCKTPSELQIMELQYLEAILNASGGGNVGTNVNLESINANSVSTGCGTADAGTLRVSQATDCNVQVLGSVASDDVDSGNPVKIGFIGMTALPTAAANLDRVNGLADKFGRQIVNSALRENRGDQYTQISSSTAETTIVTANATNMRDLYGLIIGNTSATKTDVTIRDGTGGTIRKVITVPEGETRGFMLPADSGYKQAAVNSNWTAQSSVSVASLNISALVINNPS